MKRLALVGIVALAGCAPVGPDYRQPVGATPARYLETNSAAGLSDEELANWWGAFNDPELDKLVARAIALNLDVENAAARIREARAREIVAGASGKPQVDAQGSLTRQRISENAIPIPPGAGSGGSGSGAFGLPGTEFTTFRAGFDAAWEIDLFGGTRRSVEAATSRTAAAEWNRSDLQASTAAEVASSYFALRSAQQQIANAQADLARQDRLERLIRAKARGGLITGIDLERQKSDRATTAAAIPALQAEVEAQIHALGVLSGATPEALAAELAPSGALPTAPEVPAGLPSDLLRRRPDIRAAERDAAAATADIGVATADLYPRLTLTAGPALVSTALASLIEWGSRSYTLGAGLLWPLLDGGKARGNIAIANARQEQALIAYRKSVLIALKDVEDALSRTASDRTRLAALEEAHAAAARAEHLSATRYRGGLNDYSDVLVNEGRRLALEKQMIETKSALASDTAALFKALGGGWSKTEAQS